MPVITVAECSRYRIVAGLVTSSSPVPLKLGRVVIGAPKSWDEKMDGDCKAKLAAGTVGFEAGVSLFTDPISDVRRSIDLDKLIQYPHMPYSIEDLLDIQKNGSGRTLIFESCFGVLNYPEQLVRCGYWARNPYCREMRILLVRRCGR
ncbi:hypothetical protein TNCV_2577141 [Trichonephila clavipes]|nr:hypothetical protein TNCV_2577141 [Trichonephila clavipes]